MFSEWDRIFKDPMTTAAAIDRLVHHAVILEMTGTSIRVEHAHSERAAQGAPATTTTPTTTIPTSPVHPAAEGAQPATTTASPMTPTTTTEGGPSTAALRTRPRIKNREPSGTDADGEM